MNLKSYGAKSHMISSTDNEKKKKVNRTLYDEIKETNENDTQETIEREQNSMLVSNQIREHARD